MTRLGIRCGKRITTKRVGLRQQTFSHELLRVRGPGAAESGGSGSGSPGDEVEVSQGCGPVRTQPGSPLEDGSHGCSRLVDLCMGL